MISDGDTLFVDGQLKFEASEKAENDRHNVNDWGQVRQGNLTGEATSVVLDDLRGFGDDYWNGADIYLQTHDWAYTPREIVDYDSSTGRVTFDTPLVSISQKHDTLYFITNSIRALDKPGEWHKDGNTLYYHAEAGQNPNDLEIEFKRRLDAFQVRGRDHIHIEGLNFRGGAIETSTSTDFNVYRDNVFYAYDRGGADARFRIQGTGNVVSGNEFSNTYDGGLWLSGSRHDIVNNYFHTIGFNPITRVFQFSDAEEILVSHNTIRKWSRNVVGNYPLRSEFAYNLIEDGGSTSWDTAVFDSDGTNGNNSSAIIHHNVIRNFNTRGQFEAFYGRSDNQVIHHNVVYDFAGTVTYSGRGTNFRQAYHNTFIGQAPDGTGNGRNSIGTRYNNNLQISLDSIGAIGTDTRGNHNYSPSDFVDFHSGDLRLAAGSAAIDSGIVIAGINDGTHGSSTYLGNAPDAGAIEFDPDNPNAPVWTDSVGHNFDNPPLSVYAWTPLPGTNLNDNATFVQGLGDWQVAAGSPRTSNFNSWNLKGAGNGAFLELSNNSLTGSFNSQSVQLESGEAVRRTFTDLQPDTTYTFSPAVRVIQEIVSRADLFDDQSGSVTTGLYRARAFLPT